MAGLTAQVHGEKMNENIITWNATNWITVTLMAAIAFMAFGAFKNWYGKQG